MKRIKIEDWVTMQRRRKWRWLQNVVTSGDTKWNLTALLWNPSNNPDLNAKRLPGRPKKRWINDILDTLETQLQADNKNAARHTWIDIAQDGQAWARLEQAYVNGKAQALDNEGQHAAGSG